MDSKKLIVVAESSKSFMIFWSKIDILRRGCDPGPQRIRRPWRGFIMWGRGVRFIHPTCRVVVHACLEARERKNSKKDTKMNLTALYLPGFKSHCAGLLLRKENGKCSTAKYCAEF